MRRWVTPLAMILLTLSVILTSVQPVTVSAQAFDFSLSNSGSITIGSTGGSGFNTINVGLVSGSTQPVSLTVSGLPSGATPQFGMSMGCGGQPICTTSPPSNPMLTISTTTSTPTGCFATTVIGTASGGLAHSTTFILSIGVSGFAYILSNSGDISIGAPGGTGGNIVNVGLCGTTTQTVTLTVSGQPTGANPLFNVPGSSGCTNTATCMISPPASPTLTFTTTSTVMTGTFTITVTGAPMMGSHTTTFILAIGTSGFNFMLSNSGNIVIGSAGGSGGNTINVNGGGGGNNELVTLTVSPLPSGATPGFGGCMMQPTCTVSPPSSRSLSISTMSSTPPGCSTIWVVGTSSGGLIRSTLFILKVAVTQCGSTMSSQVINDMTNAPATGTEVTGASFHDNATVSGLVGLTPTGMVTYQLYSNGGCTSPSLTSNTVNLNPDGSVPSSSPTGPLAAGSYSYSTTYTGDGNYLPIPSGPCEPFIVNKASTTTATSVFDMTTGVPVTTSGVALGDIVYDTSITGNAIAPFSPLTGSVAYTFFMNGSCSGSGSSAGGGMLSAGLAPQSMNEGPLAAGMYSFNATYSGNPNYLGSTSTCEPFTVNKAGTTTTGLVLTETDLSSSWTIPPSGAVTLGAILQVSAVNVGTQVDGFGISGTVTYNLYASSCSGSPMQSSGPLSIGSTPSNFGGTTLSSGTYCLVATYSGDTNYYTSSSSVTFVTEPGGVSGGAPAFPN